MRKTGHNAYQVRLCDRVFSGLKVLAAQKGMTQAELLDYLLFCEQAYEQLNIRYELSKSEFSY